MGRPGVVRLPSHGVVRCRDEAEPNWTIDL